MRQDSRRIASAIADDGGAAGLVLALSLLAMVGLVGLAVDVGQWYSTARRTQLAADAAAVAAAFEIAHGKSTSVAAAAALREAQKNGFAGTTACDVNNLASTADCQVYSPPRTDSGVSTSVTNAVQVILNAPAQSFFADAFVANPTVKANAVMQVTGTGSTSNSAGFCLLALDTTTGDALRVVNNGGVRCGVASNSTANTANANVHQTVVGARLDNNAMVTGDVYSAGGVAVENNGQLKGDSYAASEGSTYVGNNGVVTGVKYKSNGPVADPYAAYEPDASVYTQACMEDIANGGKAYVYKNNITKTLSPGRYCKGWDFSNNAVIYLQAGTYVLEKKLSVGNNAVLDGTTGVTLVLNGAFSVDIGNNAIYRIKAPTSGGNGGMAIYSRRTNPKTDDKNKDVLLRFSNNSQLSIQGAIYAPTQKILFDNNSNVSLTDCTQVVGRIVEVSNNGGVGGVWGTCNTVASGTKEITTPSGSTTIYTLK